ncbi:MAG: hypothetical protein K6T61_04445 [Bryobacteraceae bacterium]|nr:hypothetical protein [Bryobacteraceae bacterium]
MNGTGVGIVAAVLLLGGAGLYLGLGPGRERPGLRTITQEPLPGSWESENVNARPGSRPDSKLRKGASKAAAALPDTVPPSAAVPPQAPAGARSYPFPLAREVMVGVERSELVRRYGPPAMHTTSVEQGVPLETLVYLQRDQELATFILLRAGRVASATTSGY